MRFYRKSYRSKKSAAIKCAYLHRVLMCWGHQNFRTKETAIAHLRAYAAENFGKPTLRGWQDLTDDQFDDYEFSLILELSAFMAEYGLDLLAECTAVDLARAAVGHKKAVISISDAITARDKRLQQGRVA